MRKVYFYKAWATDWGKKLHNCKIIAVDANDAVKTYWRLLQQLEIRASSIDTKRLREIKPVEFDNAYDAVSMDEMISNKALKAMGLKFRNEP